MISFRLPPTLHTERNVLQFLTKEIKTKKKKSTSFISRLRNTVTGIAFQRVVTLVEVKCQKICVLAQFMKCTDDN